MDVLYQNLPDLSSGQVIICIIGGVLIYLSTVWRAFLAAHGFRQLPVNLQNSGAAAVIADILGRITVAKFMYLFLKEKNQSHDWRCRYLRISHFQHRTRIKSG